MIVHVRSCYIKGYTTVWGVDLRHPWRHVVGVRADQRGQPQHPAQGESEREGGREREGERGRGGEGEEEREKERERERGGGGGIGPGREREGEGERQRAMYHHSTCPCNGAKHWALYRTK